MSGSDSKNRIFTIPNLLSLLRLVMIPFILYFYLAKGNTIAAFVLVLLSNMLVRVIEPERPDECCGFGGMFSVEETAISAQMGKDKVERHIQTGAQYVTGPDCSCLMHMAGVAKKEGMNIEFIHAVEIMAAGL